MSWRPEFNRGVWLPQVGWWLDAQVAQLRAFVSHAHSDHIARHREVLCSPGTARLLEARLPGRRTLHVLPFGQEEQLTPESSITLYPAGHIAGSAQALIKHETLGRLLYTGDFKLRESPAAERCATPEADTLIMETTFGRPQYVFPPTEQIVAGIVDFCRSTLAEGITPVLLGYSLGKSQELLGCLRDAGLPIMLHPEVHRLTGICAELGFRFPPYRLVSPADVAGHVVIAPPQDAHSEWLRSLGPCRTAIASGWALDSGAVYRFRCDAAFPLSDHADFPELLRFVDAVQPKRVYTLHGFAQDFARTLRRRGIEAWAIGEPNQLEFGLESPADTPGTQPA